jgi:hypothetical protein
MAALGAKPHCCICPFKPAYLTVKQGEILGPDW